MSQHDDLPYAALRHAALTEAIAETLRAVLEHSDVGPLCVGLLERLEASAGALRETVEGQTTGVAIRRTKRRPSPFDVGKDNAAARRRNVLSENPSGGDRS